MGIRGLDAYLRERKLSQTLPLSALAHTRLGIDGAHYLKALLSDPDAREPLVAATGGLPLALVTRIENDLRLLDKLGIKPVFVFAGLPTASSRAQPRGMDGQVEREFGIKNEAWNFYENGQVERAVVALTQIRGGAWTDWRDVMRLVLRVFRHRFVEYVVAPYLEFAQLAYLLRHQKNYIHAIFSSTECLLWPIDRIITSIEWTSTSPTSPSFTFVDKSRLLNDLALTTDQFLDMSILAGCSISRTFPPLSHDFSLKTVLDLLRVYKSGIAACTSLRGDPNLKAAGYTESFMRARLSVKYSLVLTTDGTCTPLPLVQPPSPTQQITPSDVPADLEEIFSQRLPDELYFLVCRGVVSPVVVGWLSSGMIVESQPLADNNDYRRFIKDVVTEGHTAPRCTTLALLVDALHPDWKRRRVAAHYYFEPPFHSPGSIVPFVDPMCQNLVDKCKTWLVPTSILESELRRQNSSTIDIRLCIGALVSDELAAQTKRDKNSRPPLEKKDEIVANVIWRFLDARGFITPGHTQTMMGKALHAACSSARVNDRFQESLYLVLELLRAGVIHGEKWGGEALSGGPSFGTEEEMASGLLIMRVLSVLPLSFRPLQWAGPLSRELLMFNSFVRALSKALRHLFEALSVHVLLTGDARRNRDETLDLMLRLPFQSEPNTGFGILAKTYLDATTYHLNGEPITQQNVDSEEVRTAKSAAMDFVDASFSSVKNPKTEVERGFRFWDAVMVAIQTLDKEQGPKPGLARTTSPEIIAAFERADRWLRPMRP
ncbi:temperature dependent protein affecting M2 dsRNA replication-domain-containing protein [Naematelia encephala]|uniref:Temperature dependent protein affecting M2 dsRNA replication-domain-containing protein n=1 Tax=Naematelia encephala TaxID=71784 RepID=A0A1Y2AF75_9TREE|nr:temperature dependent protein affecting M2 dsRNA replication-domain-containing protein [Naematelia encephala]